MKKPLLIIYLLSLSLLNLFPVNAAAAAEDDAANPYYQIAEPFTINFVNQSEQKMRYLQIKVALKSHDPAVLESAKQNLPMIQDALRVLFTDQDYQTVSSVAGREQLQQQALEKIRQLLTEETGSDKLEQVYFTRFVLQ
jgi:flagellar FliL protein